MIERRGSLCRLMATVAMLLGGMFLPGADAKADFQVHETSIADVHQAMLAGEVTSRGLVEASLRRISSFDKTGPAINAIITLNERALQRADELDREFARNGLSGPLHGIPLVVKDNYDTHDMPTSAGSLSLIDSVPPDDAYQVRKLREAGAIIIAKTNMYEFAFSPYETVGSALPGYTRNPYCAQSRDRRIERRHRRARSPRVSPLRARHGHRELDSRPILARGAGGNSIDDRSDESRWHCAAVS